MFTNKKKSYTLVELILVIAIIGILMLSMTIYLGTSGTRAKRIEAEGCANALGGTLGNYVYYALTSRNLRLPGDDVVSPTYYYIQLTGGTQQDGKRCIAENIQDTGYFCNQILLGYATGYSTYGYNPDENIQLYKTTTVSNTCRHSKPFLGFYRTGGTSGDIQYIRMNKGFTAREVSAERVFFLKESTGSTVSEEESKLLIGEIIVVLCEDESCNGRMQIGKWQVDARTQTIAFKRCKYYEDGDESNICKTREDCRVYSSSDPTVCEKY